MNKTLILNEIAILAFISLIAENFLLVKAPLKCFFWYNIKLYCHISLNVFHRYEMNSSLGTKKKSFCARCCDYGGWCTYTIISPTTVEMNFQLQKEEKVKNELSVVRRVVHLHNSIFYQKWLRWIFSFEKQKRLKMR